MALSPVQAILLIVGLVLFQFLLTAAYVRRRYVLALRQLDRVAEQIAAGAQPGSHYVGGPPAVTRLADNLEKIGVLLGDFRRRGQEEDFNLNVLLANMVEGVMVVDRGHVVRLVNRELLSLFELETSPVGRTVLESLREARIELIVRETLARNAPQQQDVALAGPSNRPARQFEVSAVPIRTEKGGPGGVVLVFHDITRITHLEQVRSEFVANVSHELRTPLAIFRGYLETLRDQPGLAPAEVARMLDAMRRHSDRLNALVEDLLVLTRFEAKRIEIEPSLIRADAFFQQLLRDWRQRAGAEECEVKIDLPDGLPPLEADPLRFEQVIVNLLENAVAYSNPPRRVVISGARVGKEIEIRVADNGVGIPPGDLPRIFERFYRVDKGRARVSGGTGLGLSIVKEMMQAHGGSVAVESEPGKGTTVVLRLPVTEK